MTTLPDRVPAFRATRPEPIAEHSGTPLALPGGRHIYESIAVIERVSWRAALGSSQVREPDSGSAWRRVRLLSMAM